MATVYSAGWDNIMIERSSPKTIAQLSVDSSGALALTGTSSCSGKHTLKDAGFCLEPPVASEDMGITPK